MGESPGTGSEVLRAVSRDQFRSLPAAIGKSPNFAGRAVYRDETVETISFSRGMAETSGSEFRFVSVRDIIRVRLVAC